MTKSTRPRPSETPAAIALTQFRDNLPKTMVSGATQLLSPDPFFTADKLHGPAQHKVITALTGDVSRLYERGVSDPKAWSFTPGKILRGVKSTPGTLPRNDLFHVLAAEVASSPSAQITLQQRWCAMASSVAHGGMVLALKHPSREAPIYEADLTALTKVFTSIIREQSFEERMFITALAMQGKVSLLEAYLQGREDEMKRYKDIAMGLAKAVMAMPIIQYLPKYTQELIPVLQFVHSKTKNKEFLLFNPIMDMVDELANDDSVIQSKSLDSATTLLTIQNTIRSKISQEDILGYAQKSDFLFTTVAPSDQFLSESFLSSLDAVFEYLPEMRIQMPGISSVWSKSRLERLAAQAQKAPEPRRQPGL